MEIQNRRCGATVSTQVTNDVMQSADVEYCCTWEGQVEVREDWHDLELWWFCPMCGTEHTEPLSAVSALDAIDEVLEAANSEDGEPDPDRHHDERRLG
jgi:hypothetical protein